MVHIREYRGFSGSFQSIVKAKKDVRNLLKDAADVKGEVRIPSTFLVELIS